jgi:SAM-dependent methyltransferase
MKDMNTESLAMRTCRALGFQHLAWSLRRLHVPVDADALVLEVGSGGNPYPRANVLLDAYEETRERHWVPLVADRPTVLGFVEKLPFRDKVFDFVIASHVFEHSRDPAAFLGELQRVARTGYIETPDALMERLYPYPDHRLEVTVRDQALVVRKKTAWKNDPQIAEYFESKASPAFRKSLVPDHPFEFHVRYYWCDQIPLQIVNPESSLTDEGPPASPTSSNTPPPPGSTGLREKLRQASRRWLSQKSRNAGLNLADLLACPVCRMGVEKLDAAYRCGACGRNYPIRNGIPVFIS